MACYLLHCSPPVWCCENCGIIHDRWRRCCATEETLDKLYQEALLSYRTWEGKYEPDIVEISVSGNDIVSSDDFDIPPNHVIDKLKVVTHKDQTGFINLVNRVNETPIRSSVKGYFRETFFEVDGDWVLITEEDNAKTQPFPYNVVTDYFIFATYKHV